MILNYLSPRLFFPLAKFLFFLNRVWLSDSIQCCVISSHPLAQLQYQLATAEIFGGSQKPQGGLTTVMEQAVTLSSKYINPFPPPLFDSLSLNQSHATCVVINGKKRSLRGFGKGAWNDGDSPSAGAHLGNGLSVVTLSEPSSWRSGKGQSQETTIKNQIVLFNTRAHTKV